MEAQNLYNTPPTPHPQTHAPPTYKHTSTQTQEHAASFSIFCASQCGDARRWYNALEPQREIDTGRTCDTCPVWYSRRARLNRARSASARSAYCEVMVVYRSRACKKHSSTYGTTSVENGLKMCSTLDNHYSFNEALKQAWLGLALVPFVTPRPALAKTEETAPAAGPCVLCQLFLLLFFIFSRIKTGIFFLV